MAAFVTAAVVALLVFPTDGVTPTEWLQVLVAASSGRLVEELSVPSCEIES